MRLTAVSYLNTKPFIYGIYRSEIASKIDLSLDIPSVCAQKLLNGEADLALTPIAIIPQLPQAYLVSDYCIGAEGAVKTVCIFSDQPLSQIKRIYLDFHSRTSAALTRALCEHYWGIQPELLPSAEGFERLIGGDTAALIIGDRAFGLDQKYAFTYDLGAEWTAWTGLPFVFAAWVSTRPLPEDFVAEFNGALQSGLDHLPELLKILPAMPGVDIEAYFRSHISYPLDDAKWTALQRFLGLLAGENGYRLERNLSPRLSEF